MRTSCRVDGRAHMATLSHLAVAEQLRSLYERLLSEDGAARQDPLSA